MPSGCDLAKGRGSEVNEVTYVWPFSESEEKVWCEEEGPSVGHLGHPSGLGRWARCPALGLPPTHNQVSHPTQREKGPDLATSVTLAISISLREAVIAVLSSTHSGTDGPDIPSCSRLEMRTKPCRHVNGTVCERPGEDREHGRHDE
jgi:hypothetical protein